MFTMIIILILAVIALVGLIAASAYDPAVIAAGAPGASFNAWYLAHRAGMRRGFAWALGLFAALAVIIAVLVWLEVPLSGLATVIFWLAVGTIILLLLGSVLGWGFVKLLIGIAIGLVVIAGIVAFLPKFGVSLPQWDLSSAGGGGGISDGEQQILDTLVVINETNDQQDTQIENLGNRMTAVEEKVENITTNANGDVIVNEVVKTCEGLHDYQLVDLTELSSEDNLFIHVQYGRGGKEYETLLPPGRYAIVSPFADGHVWELGPRCTAGEALTKHVGPSIERRIIRKVNSGGYVHWQTLVDDGTLEIIWQQPGEFEIPTTLTGTVDAAAQPPAAGTTGYIGRDDDADGRVVESANIAFTIEAWEPVDGIVVVPVGESISGVKGAVYQWDSTEAAMADARSKGKPVYEVNNGQLDPLD